MQIVGFYFTLVLLKIKITGT